VVGEDDCEAAFTNVQSSSSLSCPNAPPEEEVEEDGDGGGNWGTKVDVMSSLR
jgi:hypothetical protein